MVSSDVNAIAQRHVPCLDPSCYKNEMSSATGLHPCSGLEDFPFELHREMLYREILQSGHDFVGGFAVDIGRS